MPRTLVHALHRSVPRYTEADPSNEALVEAARRRNAEAGITGILYREGWVFFHYIEGERALVERAVARVRRDDRHYRMVRLAAGPVAERLMPGAPMHWCCLARHGGALGLSASARDLHSRELPAFLRDLARRIERRSDGPAAPRA